MHEALKAPSYRSARHDVGGVAADQVAADLCELQRGEASVQRTLQQELRVGSHGNLVAVIHHDDTIRLENGREAMRNDDRGSSPHELLERFLHQSLRLRVQ